MALPDVRFKRGNLVGGQPLPGKDYISGLVIYRSALPSGFPSVGYKQCFSLGDAEAVGITDGHIGETKATGTIEITHIGAQGDTILVQVQEPNQLVTLGTYTLQAGDTTVNLTATNLAAYLNTQTQYNGGYTASAATDTVTVTARPGLGKALNTGTNLLNTIVSSALTTTLTQFTGGVGSDIDVYHYHIQEFFAANPGGVLWVGIFAIPGTFDGAELRTLQTAAGGDMRQCGVYIDQHAYAAADLTKLNIVANQADIDHMPVSVIVGADIHATSDLSTLDDLSLLSNEWVSITIGQDGGALGNLLYKAYGKSITNLGALLGSISASKVSQSVANPSNQFNISDGTENEVAAFANGQLFKTIQDTSPNLLTQLDDRSYIFVRKFTGYNGTYFTGEWTAIAHNSNYCHISDNRVISKIERLLYPAFLPTVLQAEIQLNADGTIFFPVVKSLESTGDNALDIMNVNQEISAIQTKIDPTQNLKTSSVFKVAVNYLQNYIARTVEVSINKVTSLS